ncbi:MAG: extracellular solute-binding protein [Patescibacteria group bacterium]
MKFPQPRKLFRGVLACSLLFTLGVGCGDGSENPNNEEEVQLTYWRVFDGDDAFDEIIDEYNAQHPYVSIDYKVLRFDEYEEELIRALAEGEGPDIFTIHNTQMNEYKDLLLPMPTSVTTKYLETVGSVRKETVLTTKEYALPSQRSLKEDFVDVVATDVILPYQPDEDTPEEDRVFGLPLSVDTLALYYNKDLFDAAGIAQAPTTWEEFQANVIALTQYADDGSVLQSGASLGTTENVDRASDIIQVLMLQNGTEMIDDTKNIMFNSIPDDVASGVFPGLDAVRFFTDFANPVKETYTWNADFSANVDAFASGQTAMMLGYSYHLPIIQATSPTADIGVAPLPQIGGGAKKANFANYWIESVSKDTEHPDEAWDFVVFATSAEHVLAYLNETQKPTALRELIDEQIENETLNPFVEQILTAQSWYHGTDAQAMDAAFEDLATEVLSGNREAEDAIDDAAEVVAQTY